VKTRNDDRNFFLLEDIGIKPTVSYLLKVRNQDEPIHEHKAAVKHEGKTEHHEEKHS
jgi:hypothetical protein